MKRHNALINVFQIVLVLGCASCALARAGDDAKPAPSGLTVTGEIEKPLNLTAADLMNMTRHTVRTQEKGKEIIYEGVAATDVLKKAGLKLGEKQMRSEKLLLYVLAEATDGYKVLFALSEFDPDLTDKVFLIADRRDGQPLTSTEGPLRLIIPSEGMHSRWAKQLITLRIARAPGEQKPSAKHEP